MKRFIKYTIATFILTIVWSIIVLYGLLNGWWHKPITKNKDIESFIAAVKKISNSEFVGNFAMAIMKDGKVEREIFFCNGATLNAKARPEIENMMIDQKIHPVCKIG